MGSGVGALKANKIWANVKETDVLKTPSGRREFRVARIDPDGITIQLASSKLNIPRAAFEAAINYLDSRGHTESNKCRIGANDNPDLAGPLCLATRQTDSGRYGPRNITYVLPILKQHNVVGIDSAKPSQTWLT